MRRCWRTASMRFRDKAAGAAGDCRPSVVSCGASGARSRKNGRRGHRYGAGAMNIKVRWAIASGVAAFALWIGAAHAGPCAGEIYDADIAINKRLDAAAAKGKPAAESSFATMHRQP